MNDEEMTVPDGVEPLVGYRVFNRAADSLTSMSMPTAWGSGVNKATCLARGNDMGLDVTTVLTPNKSIPEGAHIAVDFISAGYPVVVLRNGVQAGEMLRFEQPRPHRPPEKNCGCGFWALRTLEDAVMRGPGMIVGRVKCWGRIQKFSEGWRSEYAEVTALSDHELAEKWGVETLTIPDEVLLKVAGNSFSRNQIVVTSQYGFAPVASLKKPRWWAWGLLAVCVVTIGLMAYLDAVNVMDPWGPMAWVGVAVSVPSGLVGWMGVIFR